MRQKLYIAPLFVSWWFVATSIVASYLCVQPEMLYFGIAFWVLFAFPLFKVGISKNVAVRKKYIDESAWGNVLMLFVGKLSNAYKWEQRIHKALSWCNVRYMGSGKTEYFLIIALPIALSIFIWAKYRILIIVAASLVAYHYLNQ